MYNLTPQYIAGVSDSDGSFSLSKCNKQTTSRGYHYRTIFQLTWEDTIKTREVMEQLKEKYGGTYHECVRKPNQYAKEHKIVLKYGLENNRLAILIEDILPYLILKKERAEIILQFIKERNKRGNGKGVKKDSDWEREEELYLEMNKLNSKNVKI